MLYCINMFIICYKCNYHHIISKVQGLIILVLSFHSLDLSVSREEREQKRKQATARVMFVQDLFLSTLFED